MIKNLISNIIQNYRGNFSETSQNNPNNNAIGDKFDALLKSIHNESLKPSSYAQEYNLLEKNRSEKNNNENEITQSEGSDLEQQPLIDQEINEQLLPAYEKQLEIEFENYSIKVEDEKNNSEKISSNNKVSNGELLGEIEKVDSEDSNIQIINTLLSDEQELIVRNAHTIKTENVRVENNLKNQFLTPKGPESELIELNNIKSEIIKNKIITNFTASIDRSFDFSNKYVDSSEIGETLKIDVQTENQKLIRQSGNEQLIKPELSDVNNSREMKFTSQSILSKQENKNNSSESLIGKKKLEDIFSTTATKKEKINAIQLESIKGIQASQNSLEFSKSKNPELMQLAQVNKPNIIKQKQLKELRNSFPTTQLSQTRLKLSVSPTKPTSLSKMENLVGHSTTKFLEEKNQLFNQTLSLSNDQAIMLKDLMIETTYGTDQKSTEHNMAGYFRLGELPTANTQLRRALVSSFMSVLRQEKNVTPNQQNSIWQKHNFKFDDGNNIDMTTKNIDGILHVKLAASSQELNRLLINMEQEIKDHLKKELNLDLELDFGNKNEQSFSDSMQEHNAKNEKQNHQNRSNVSDKESIEDLEKNVLPSIRNFGYNQTEWTA